MAKKRIDGWEATNRLEYVWSLIERFGAWVGVPTLLGAGPTGHAIGGITALFYVIPMTALGAILCFFTYRRYTKRTAPPPSEPLRREYTRERIDIVALAERYGGQLNDITFIECEIMGPAVICGAGGTITNYNPRHFARDNESAFIEIPEGRTRPDGAIGVSDCIFQHCRFHFISWATSIAHITTMKQYFNIPTAQPTPHTPDSPTPPASA